MTPPQAAAASSSQPVFDREPAGAGDALHPGELGGAGLELGGHHGGAQEQPGEDRGGQQDEAHETNRGAADEQPAPG